MPQAGQVIRARDFSPLAIAHVADQFEQLVTAGFQPTVPSCEVTFLAPTSGIVRFDMSYALDADAANERISTDVEVREDNSSGTLIRAADPSDGQGIIVDYPVAGTAFVNYPGHRILSGLVPGRTYFAQLQHSTAGIDLRQQNLAVVGIP